MRGIRVLTVATMIAACVAVTPVSVSADPFTLVSRSDLVSGNVTLQVGQAYGIWVCWNTDRDITLYVLDAGGTWRAVSTDRRMSRDPNYCPSSQYPYMSTNAWTVNIYGSQGTGVKKDVLAFAFGWNGVAPTASYALARIGPAQYTYRPSWSQLTSGYVPLSPTSQYAMSYPGCSFNGGNANLYALDGGGRWRTLGTYCNDSWRLPSNGSLAVGAQTGVVLLSAAKAAPLYYYGLARVR